MDHLIRKLDRGLESLAERMDKWGEGTGGEEWMGELYSINGARYRLVKKLAEGGFAFVFLAEEVETKRLVALKRILVQDDEHVEIIKREISILKRLKGKEGIIPFLGAASFRKANRKEIVVLTEFCPRGSVLDLMHQRERNRMIEAEILLIFETVCKAVYHMHSQDPPIAHRDLKVENVLVGKSGALYLIDFGSASIVTYDTEKPHIRNIAENDINRNTTLLYRAPEMVDLYRKQLIDEKVDIWALGCMLYKMMYYTDPFEGNLGILNVRYRTPDCPPYTPKMHDLLKFLLVSDPEKRPDINDVLEKLGISMPRIKPKALNKSSPKAKSRIENGDGNDLFTMLEWQKNEEPAPTSTEAVQQSQSNGLPQPSPQLVTFANFEEKTANGGGSSNKSGDFFVEFDTIHCRQPSPPPFTSPDSVLPVELFPDSSSSLQPTTARSVSPSDEWKDFGGFSSPAPASSTPAASLKLDSLMSALPSPSSTKKVVEKQDILSLYSSDPSPSPPVTTALNGAHPYSGSSVPMGLGFPPPSPLHMMPSPVPIFSQQAPFYSRSPSPLSSGSAPRIGALPMVSPASLYRTPSPGAPSFSSNPPGTLGAMANRSSQQPATKGLNGGDPFAALWNSANK